MLRVDFAVVLGVSHGSAGFRGSAGSWAGDHGVRMRIALESEGLVDGPVDPFEISFWGRSRVIDFRPGTFVRIPDAETAELRDNATTRLRELPLMIFVCSRARW